MGLRAFLYPVEEKKYQSSTGFSISMIQGVPVPLPSIAENDNEDFEHVIRQGRSGLHANDNNLMQITEQEEFADEEYHHQDSSSFAFHPGELVSLVQNFQQFSENFETLVATLRPANTYKTEQEEQVLEAYHQTQVNDAKETLTDLAQRLRASRKDAVERVLARLEKENMRRKEEGKPTLHPESAEVQEIIQEEAAEYQERADHHLNKVARYGEDQVWDAPVSAAFEQALECARVETENATSFLDTIKSHLKQWVIKEVHASLEEMSKDQNKSTGTLVLETGISVATDVTTGLVLNKAVQGAGKLISSGAKNLAQTPWGKKTTQFITEKSTQILDKGLSKLGRTETKIVQPKVAQKSALPYSDLRKMGDYSKQIEQLSSRMPKNQVNELKGQLRTKQFEKMESQKLDAHREQFTKAKKDKLRQEWSEKTQQPWPTYEKPVLKKDGTPYKNLGDPYDAHHVIPQEIGGPHEWWNMAPVPFPEHQTIVHGSGSIIKEIIKNLPKK